MRPTLNDGDRLLVNRLAYRFAPPRHGDIVLVRDPTRPGFECIKRVVAVPGERVDVLGTSALLRSAQYYVLGDNRAFSTDSRVWGPITGAQILGRAWHRYSRGSSRQ